MLYAQFFHKSAVGPELVEACGDRAVIVLDARERSDTHDTIARQECAKRGYLAFQLNRGDTFTRSVPVSGIKTL